MDWQPIETIPHETNGEAPAVLLYHPHSEHLSMITSNPVYACVSAKEHGYTHWMPLPSPPVTEG